MQQWMIAIAVLPLGILMYVLATKINGRIANRKSILGLLIIALANAALIIILIAASLQ